eukprot:TRINITY_DN4865_c0_g1_i1.p1 TRINITY_DN4865_c0_g1~~TRINITY_DN4865_c0_g1_i1.p1  ORF type:complete len:273 (+),score=84.84 TRINITY_DN4865_c0_g1_i1:152-970(+)
MDDFEERQKERERRRQEREEARKKEEEEFERERAKRQAETEERRRKREEERAKLGISISLPSSSVSHTTPSSVSTKSTAATSTEAVSASRASTCSVGSDASIEVDDNLLAEIELQVLAEMEAELEAQAALELELEADKMLAELMKETAVTPKPRTTVATQSAPRQTTARATATSNYRPPVDYSSGSHIEEESLLDKKAARKAWLESLMKNEQQEKRKVEIQQRHREINKEFAKKGTETARSQIADVQDCIDILDEDDEEWANNLLKEIAAGK